MKALLIVSFASVVAVSIGCEHDQPVQRSADDPYLTAPLHASSDLRVRFYDSSRVRAELTAGTASVFEDRHETDLGGGVRVVFFDRTTGKQAAVLTADSAIIDDRSKDMTAIGNVVVVSDSTRTKLQTSRLVWDEATERIRTTEAVRITSPTEVIEGQGLISDQFLTDYRLFKVRGVHQP
jgi:LPS export ABC transporter protein LptC